MGTIDLDSIVSKAQKCMTKKYKNQVEDMVDNHMRGDNEPNPRPKKGSLDSMKTAEDAGYDFARVLLMEIRTSEALSQGVRDALDDYDNIFVSPAVSIGKSGEDREYMIKVYFNNEISRQSLVPAVYDDIKDLAILYNDGVDHMMKPVLGEWHGHPQWSKTVIPGAHFMEAAIDDFYGNYGSEDHVKKITLHK